MFRGGITGLLGNQELASITAAAVRVDINALAATLFAERGAAIEHFNKLSAGALLILAWETTHGDHTPHPDWEFLRHLRNAAAHGGSFELRGREPRHPAHWRSLAITRELNGRALFAAPVATGFIGIGDVLHLLADIEQRHFGT